MNADIISKLIKIQKAKGYTDGEMGQMIGCSRQTYQATRTGMLTPAKKILTFFVTGEADRMLQDIEGKNFIQRLLKR